jgi:hypothetical protein
VLAESSTLVAESLGAVPGFSFLYPYVDRRRRGWR